MLQNDDVLNMDYDDQTRLINLSTTFLHGKVRLTTHKATLLFIINKLIMSTQSWNVVAKEQQR